MDWKKILRRVNCAFCPVTVLSDEDSTYEIPDGRLVDRIVVTSEDNQTISIGTTLAGTEIANAQALTGGSYLTFSTAVYGGTLYFHGHTTETTFKIYLR